MELTTNQEKIFLSQERLETQQGSMLESQSHLLTNQGLMMDQFQHMSQQVDAINETQNVILDLFHHHFPLLGPNA